MLTAVPGDDLQDKIDWTGKRGGGEVSAMGGHVHPEVLKITGSGVTLKGESKQSTSVLCRGLKVTGMGHKVSDLWLYRNEFTDNPADRMLDVDGCVQCHFHDLNLNGGYHSLAVTGGADNTFERICATFATGTSLYYVANGASSMHFRRVMGNQEYPMQWEDISVPIPSSYKTWGAGQQFNRGDVVQVGNYWYRCKTGGVSQAGPKPAFYHTDIPDGPVTWRFMAHAAYRGFHCDTGASIIRLDGGSDFTGPFINAIEITNYLGGAVPWDIKIDTVTAHGAIYNGLCMVDGREVKIRNFNAYASTGSGTKYGIALIGGDDCEVHTPELYSWAVGIYDGLDTPIFGGTIADCQVGIQHTRELKMWGTRFESKARGRTVTPTQKV
jgi:hypothetical protein